MHGGETNKHTKASPRVPFWYLVAILQFWVQDVSRTLKYTSTVKIFVRTFCLGPQFVWAEANINGREVVEYPDSIIDSLRPKFNVGVFWPQVSGMKQTRLSPL